MKPDRTNLLLSATGPAVGLALLALAAAGGLQPSLAQAGSVEIGRAFVETHCAGCHAVGHDDVSALEQAPPFRRLHERYPVEHLAEALAEGIVTGHPDMPDFTLEPAQIDDVIAYLKSLEE